MRSGNWDTRALFTNFTQKCRSARACAFSIEKLLCSSSCVGSVVDFFFIFFSLSPFSELTQELSTCDCWIASINVYYLSYMLSCHGLFRPDTRIHIALYETSTNFTFTAFIPSHSGHANNSSICFHLISIQVVNFLALFPFIVRLFVDWISLFLSLTGTCQCFFRLSITPNCQLNNSQNAYEIMLIINAVRFFFIHFAP